MYNLCIMKIQKEQERDKVTRNIFKNIDEEFPQINFRYRATDLGIPWSIK